MKLTYDWTEDDFITFNVARMRKKRTGKTFVTNVLIPCTVSGLIFFLLYRANRLNTFFGLVLGGIFLFSILLFFRNADKANKKMLKKLLKSNRDQLNLGSKEITVTSKGIVDDNGLVPFDDFEQISLITDYLLFFSKKISHIIPLHAISEDQKKELFDHLSQCGITL